ncbi:MAG: ORF6N domain-containing protein [Flavobacteriales bacterium]|nr:ORF6N domain-containing protein [Flavobacteriales bacterium]
MVNDLGISVPDEIVLNKIYLIRGEKVMLDRDLAELYGVETKYLKRQVRRNENRFPVDFMFQLDEDEFKEWRSQFVTSNSPDTMGLRYAPFAFTEQGVAQLSSVLNSERAIAVNIQIIRLFTRMRKLILNNQDILAQLEHMRERMAGQDERIDLIFEYLKQFEESKQQETIQQNRRKIGYRRNDGE